MSRSAVNVVAAIIFQNSQILIAKRPNNKHQGGYWEFPGGKIEHNEEALFALKRELKEELNIELIKATEFDFVEFDYADKNVNIKFFLVTQFAGMPEGLEGQPICWVNPTQLTNYEFPEANRSVVAKILKEI